MYKLSAAGAGAAAAGQQTGAGHGGRQGEHGGAAEDLEQAATGDGCVVHGFKAKKKEGETVATMQFIAEPQCGHSKLQIREANVEIQ